MKHLGISRPSGSPAVEERQRERRMTVPASAEKKAPEVVPMDVVEEVETTAFQGMSFFFVCVRERFVCLGCLPCHLREARGRSLV